MRGRTSQSAGPLAAFMLVALVASTCPGSSSAQMIKSEQALENFDFVWETIRDTHFDQNLNGVDWNAVRTEMRPRAQECGDLTELRVLLRQTLAELDQSHFNIIAATPIVAATTDQLEIAINEAFKSVPNHMGRPNVGLDVRVVDGELLVTEVEDSSSADAAGIRLGWAIEAIASYDLAEISARIGQACLFYGEDEAASREFYLWAVAGQMLSGPEGSTVAIRLRRGDSQGVDLVLENRAVPWELSAIGGLPAMPIRVDAKYFKSATGPKIGLIKINYIWLPKTVLAFEEALAQVKDADALVIDIRGNMGGVGQAAQGVAGYLSNETYSFGTLKGRYGEIPSLVQPRSIDRNGNNFVPLNVPIALLIDGHSASTSEVFAAGLKDAHLARLFGEKTTGVALPATISTLPNGDKLLHAIYDYVRTNGERIEDNPVQPDNIVELKRQDLLDQKDAPLDRAVVWLADQFVSKPGE